mmetsp:Transcript_24833/g.55115  ORF Transcript_24833/g.55115 Transcript_24833/m.55115 type:complete len:200 (+) Transcript_24833:49-648(+)
MHLSLTSPTQRRYCRIKQYGTWESGTLLPLALPQPRRIVNRPQALQQRRVRVVVHAVERVGHHIGQVLDRDLHQTRGQGGAHVQSYCVTIGLELVLARVEGHEQVEHLLDGCPEGLREQHKPDKHRVRRRVREAKRSEQPWRVLHIGERQEERECVELHDEEALHCVPQLPVTDLVTQDRKQLGEVHLSEGGGGAQCRR